MCYHKVLHTATDTGRAETMQTNTAARAQPRGLGQEEVMALEFSFSKVIMESGQQSLRKDRGGPLLNESVRCGNNRQNKQWGF